MVSNKVSWWRTSFGDEEVNRLAQSVANENISQGPVTEEFEAKLAASLDVPYAVVTTSGSVALYMALAALGVAAGDEVIVPDRTWVATAHAVLLTGAKVVLVDVLPDVTVLDPSRLREKVSSRTKAIMPVHLNGRTTDMAAVQQVADEFRLNVVEDACQALFSKNSQGYLGTQSQAGCFSLGVSKLISTGQGGFVVTRDQETYERLKLVRNHGVVDQFTDTWNQMGFNFKFTDLLASFGLVQLSKSESRIRSVHAVYNKYMEVLPEFQFLQPIPVNVAGGELPLYMEVNCAERERLINYLTSQGIQTRPFPPSLHTSSYLNDPDANLADDFPNSNLFGQQGMYLPCGPDQPLENIDRVIDALKNYAARA